MEPFVSLRAVAVPLDVPNVDTDQIIPARFLGMPRSEQGDALFRDLRFDEHGNKRPEFVLNKPAYAQAKILVADVNFGCGSSRENAVTTLIDSGFRAFIAPSFGDIFFSNCFQNGVLPIRLGAERLAEIRGQLNETPGARIAIDLSAQTVTGPDGKVDTFEVDSFRRDCLLKGVDEIALTLGYADDIDAYERAHARELSWIGS